MSLEEMIARAKAEAAERWARNKKQGEAGLVELQELLKKIEEEDEDDGGEE